MKIKRDWLPTGCSIMETVIRKRLFLLQKRDFEAEAAKVVSTWKPDPILEETSPTE